MKHLSPKERIESLLMYTGLNVAEFSDSIGAKSSQSVYDILRGKTASISRNMYRLIKSRHPEISGDWLRSGEGDMLNSNTIVQNNQNQVGTTIANSVNYGKGLTAQKTIEETQEQLSKVIEQTSQLIQTIQSRDEQINRLLSVIEKLQMR